MRYTIQNSKQREGAIFIDIPEFLKAYANVFSVVVAITNLFLVRAVFNFEKRKDQPKVSVTPKFEVDREVIAALFGKSTGGNTEDSIETVKDYYLRDLIPEHIVQERGLPSLDLIKVDYSDYGTRGISDKELNKINSSKILGIYLKNHGNFPSSNIQVKMLFRTYGTAIPYPIENNIYKKMLPRELHNEYVIDIDTNFMNGDEERYFPICELHGQFREAELILLEIKANGFDYMNMNKNRFKGFFSKPREVVLHHYKHRFLETIDIQKISKSKIDSFYGIKTENE